MTTVAQAVEDAHKAARSVAGVSITYTRGVYSVTLQALPGDSVHALEYDGVTTEIQSRDYLVLSSELVLNGSEVTPERHDSITEGSTTYSALAVGGEPHWRWADPHHVLIRIHCKEV